MRAKPTDNATGASGGALSAVRSCAERPRYPSAASMAASSSP